MSSARRQSSNGKTSDALLQQVVALAHGGAGERLNAKVFGRSKVWFKRYGAERRQFGKWLHAAISPLLYPDFLRSSPWLTPLVQAEREYRKMAAFAAAGFRVPRVLYRGRGVIAMMDAGETLPLTLQRLRDNGEVDTHDAHLVSIARTLGEIHAAGLCHGRPHPRDFVVNRGKLGVLDFEEEPEAAMPLASAQARDVWLLFFHIPTLAVRADTPARALAAYFSVAPAGNADEVARLVRFFQRLAPVGEAAAKIHLGGDLRRFLEAMRFFRNVRISGDAVWEAPADGPPSA